MPETTQNPAVRRIIRAAGDGLFLALTRPHQPAWPTVQVLVAAHEQLRNERWQIRVAGPRWFAAFHRDIDRLTRLRTILLPERWVGMTDAETALILAGQLRSLGLGDPDRADLAASNRAIWIKLARSLGTD